MKDIREQKDLLRKQNMQFRDDLSAEKKGNMDQSILQRALALHEYDTADVLYTYVSKASEPDTSALIISALEAGKHVAVPRCLSKTLEMEFLEIASLSELELGTYGVLEPVSGKCRPILATASAFCVVPGLAFDSEGYRLGYGKGYYDRFLSKFSGFTVGLCYSGCVQSNLPHGFYDRPVDMLITEKYIQRIAGSPKRR